MKLQYKRKNKSIVLVFLLLVGVFFYSIKPYSTSALTGTGDSGDPYLINNAADLASLSSYLGATYDDKYFEITADIDLGAYGTWTELGAGLPGFRGYLDGNDHTIDGLTINSSTIYAGLFGYTYNADISNINFTNVDITNSNQNTGTIVGYADNTRLTNITVESGTVTASNAYIGGITGRTQNSTLINVNSAANVTYTSTGSPYIGGVVGYTLGASNSITSSSASGEIRGSATVGGFVGYHGGGTITESYASGDIRDGSGGSTNFTSGGFVGRNCAEIRRSYARGDVYGNTQIGGFVGVQWGAGCSSALITNSYAKGNVYPSIAGPSSTNGGGGFIQYFTHGTITNSYSKGAVNNTNYLNAGFVQDEAVTATANNNFWDTTTSTQSTSGDAGLNFAYGKNTSEMKDISTFTDTATTGLTSAWDFVGTQNDDVGNNDYWDIDVTQAKNEGYPYLTWQSFAGINSSPTVNTLGPTSPTDLVNGGKTNDTTPQLIV